ncbi:hypothetical protein TRFO_02982 [Tritrichomonas foetus]|uniref:Uncharacterized protein n=1 Tax=Tritrichomonas foetus TaxID=1144522 RepID=A0A1J4KYE2_9EUKA|nr:hypothetical protein TRFO_02982 [Tritrichomonas foetus]|eukprot:OHT14726.1 hypothetical protein TRFO_02982 [Tritrichomonas foetus]
MSALIFQLLDNLLNEVEKDLKFTERFNTPIPAFSPILWLESPERKYVSTIQGLCGMDPISTLSYLMNQLTPLVYSLINSPDANSKTFNSKKVLVICELIKLLQCHKCDVNTIHHLRSLIKLKYADDKIGLHNDQLIEAINSIIYLISKEKIDILEIKHEKTFNLLEFIPYFYCSVRNVPAFTTALSMIAKFLPKLNNDDRDDAIDLIYDWISTFYKKHPKVHKEMLLNDSLEVHNHAESIIDTILDWKLTLDVEYLAICGALIPLCIHTLKAKSDKKKPFPGILHALKSFKQKKESHRISVFSGLIELMDAIVLASNRYEFRFFTNTLNKIKPKLDEWLFKTKRRHAIMYGKFLYELMPRYAAIEYSNKESFTNRAVAYVTQKLSTFIECQTMTNFLNLLCDEYPRKFDLSKIPQEKLNDLSSYFIKVLSDAQREKSNSVSLQTCLLVVNFCNGRNREEFSALNLLSIQNRESLKVEVGIEMKLFQSGLTQITSAQIIGGVLSLIILNLPKTIDPFILFLRGMLCWDSKMTQSMLRFKNTTAMDIAKRMSTVIYRPIAKALTIGSPMLSVIPILFFRFMRWTEKILLMTIIGSPPINDGFMGNVCNSMIILRATTSDPIINTCESILDNILQFYKGNQKYKFPFPKIPPSDQVITTSIQNIFSLWLASLNKLIFQEGLPAALTLIDKPSLLFDVTREDIAIMTQFLCQCAYLLSEKFHSNLPSSVSLHHHFFESILLFYNVLTLNDPNFTDCFKYLNPNSINTFLTILVSHIKSKFISMNFSNKFYIINVANSLSNVISNHNLTYKMVQKIDSILPVFLSILQFGVYDDFSTINVLCNMLSSFFSQKIHINQLCCRSVYTVLIQIGYKYSKNIDQNGEKLVVITKSLATILEHLDLSSDIGIEHISEWSSQNKQIKEIKYILNTLSTFITNLPHPDIVATVQSILCSLLYNNPSLSWPIYSSFILESKPLFSMMLTESLTNLFGTFYKSTKKPAIKVSDVKSQESSEYEDTSESPNQQSHSVKAKKLLFKGLGRKSKPDISLMVKNIPPPPPPPPRPDIPIDTALALHNYAHYSMSPHKNHLGNIKTDRITGNVYDMLLQNNFAVFRQLNEHLDSIFVRSAVSCLIQYNMHDKLFDTMLGSYIQEKPSLYTDNTHSIFFKGWFMQLASRWNIEKIYETFQIHDFVANLNIPNSFAFYLLRFYNETKCTISILSQLFIDCFLKPLFSYPILYGVRSAPRNSQFLDDLVASNEYRFFINELANSETFYPLLKPRNFEIDQTIVFSYLSKKSFSTDMFYFGNNSIAKNMTAPSPNEMYLLTISQFFLSVGKTATGAKVYLVIPIRIPDVSYLDAFYYFCNHFQNDESRFEIILMANEIPTKFLEIIGRFARSPPQWFLKRCNRVIILNPSFSLNSSFEKVGVRILDGGPEVKITNNIEEVYKHDDNVSLPYACYRANTKGLGHVPVFVSKEPCILYFSPQYFLLCKEGEVLGKKVTLTRTIDLNVITAVKKSNEGVHLMVNDGAYKLMTSSGDYIEAVYNLLTLHKEKTQSTKHKGDIPILPNLQSHSIALSLHILSLGKLHSRISALMLLESALGVDFSSNTSKFNCDISDSAKCRFNVHPFFNVIKDAGVLDRVIESLLFFIPFQPIDALQQLLPLFVMFYNTTSDVCIMIKLAELLVKRCEISSTLYLFERLLWANIHSDLAIRYLIPFVILSEIPTSSVKRILHAMIPRHEKLYSDIIIKQILDGTLRRKSFSKLNPFSVFDLISTLPFNAIDFVLSDFPCLLMCCVYAATLANTENVKYLANFIENSLRAIEINKQIDLTFERNKISSILSNPRVLSINSLISTMSKITQSVDCVYFTEFNNLLTKSNESDSRNVWYLKASSNVLNNHGNPNIPLKYIQMLPSFIGSNSKLIFFFQTLNKLTDTLDPQNKSISSLFWLPLIATLSSDSFLSQSALQLLEALLVFSLSNLSFDELCNSRFLSREINMAIMNIEKTFSVDFTKNFALSLAFVLNTAFEEQDTHEQAKMCLKQCMYRLSSNKQAASNFLLPFVAFDNDDPWWIFQLFHVKTIPEAVFYEFDEKSLEERKMIAQYLASMYGQRYTINKKNDIIECLIYGARKYPHEFAAVQGSIVSKCWKILGTQKNFQIVELVTSLTATFIGIKDKHKCIQIPELSISFLNENTYNICIQECTNGIVKLFSGAVSK